MQDFHLKAPKVNLSKNTTLDSNSTPIPNKDFSNSNSIHSCLPKGAELNQTLVGRRANSTLPTGPDRGVCLVTQLAGLRMMC